MYDLGILQENFVSPMILYARGTFFQKERLTSRSQVLYGLHMAWFEHYLKTSLFGFYIIKPRK